MRRAVLAVLLALPAPVLAQADCAAPSSAADRIVCDTGRLPALERSLGRLDRSARPGPGADAALSAAERAWIRGQTNCLVDAPGVDRCGPLAFPRRIESLRGTLGTPVWERTGPPLRREIR